MIKYDHKTVKGTIIKGICIENCSHITGNVLRSVMLKHVFKKFVQMYNHVNVVLKWQKVCANVCIQKSRKSLLANVLVA